MRAAKGIRAHLAEAPVQNLALGHKVLDRAGNIFNRNLRVNAVLIHKIDSIGPKPFEHPFDSLLDMVRLAVQPHLETAGLRFDVPAELRGDCDLVPEWCDALTEDSFAFEGPISLSRIKKRHAMVIGRADDIDHLRAVRHERFITAAHILDAQTHARYLERTQLASPIHSHLSASFGCRRD